MSALARLLGTFFFLGYVPKAPGTAGSLGALAIAWLLHAYLGTSGAGIAFFGLLLLAPAIWAADRDGSSNLSAAASANNSGWARTVPTSAHARRGGARRAHRHATP